ncbi:MAG: hypothetical protein U0744_16680 [Gemmataceae bacterium]
MALTPVLDREEYIEQAYFFRTLRERLAENLPTQSILERVHEELLSTTRLPMAVQFLAAELKHTGQLSSGFARLRHYFTRFQTLVIAKTEAEKNRFSIEVGLEILEKEARYRTESPSREGLFVYCFETMSRNRLGYDEGLSALKDDAFFDEAWRGFFDLVRKQFGTHDFADLIFARSVMYVQEQRRRNPDYEPPLAPLFGEKEGKIARASLGRDPLYLFAALQRQLNYPAVPRMQHIPDPGKQVATLTQRLQAMETRLKLIEGEVRGKVDLSEFLARPPKLTDDEL